MLKSDHNQVTEQDRLKYEIAEELGFLSIVLSRGWGALTTMQSGKIGGVMQARLRDRKH